MRCTAIAKNGKQCAAQAIQLRDKCVFHCAEEIRKTFKPAKRKLTRYRMLQALKNDFLSIEDQHDLESMRLKNSLAERIINLSHELEDWQEVMKMARELRKKHEAE